MQNIFHPLDRQKWKRLIMFSVGNNVGNQVLIQIFFFKNPALLYVIGPSCFGEVCFFNSKKVSNICADVEWSPRQNIKWIKQITQCVTSSINLLCVLKRSLYISTFTFMQIQRKRIHNNIYQTVNNSGYFWKRAKVEVEKGGFLLFTTCFSVFF